MFDSVADGREPTDAESMLFKENIMRCLLGNEPTRFALCRKYFSMKDLMYIKNREIGTGCIGGKAAGMLLARNILRDEARSCTTLGSSRTIRTISARTFSIPTPCRAACGAREYE